jgi:hypothetical protein
VDLVPGMNYIERQKSGRGSESRLQAVMRLDFSDLSNFEALPLKAGLQTASLNYGAEYSNEAKAPSDGGRSCAEG